MKHYKVKFDPKKDITAYELALCAKYSGLNNTINSVCTDFFVPDKEIERHYDVELAYTDDDK